MKRIKIDLDGDIGKVNSEIDDLIKQIQAIPTVLAKDGATHVNYQNYPVTVTTGKGRIIARGEQVGFAEWGTGIMAVYDPEAPIPTGFGTWSASEEGSKQLITQGYWYYQKQRFVGTPATRAMTNTVDYLKRNGGRIARENIK